MWNPLKSLFEKFHQKEEEQVKDLTNPLSKDYQENSAEKLEEKAETSVELADHTIVVLCGPTGSGKSTFAHRLQSGVLNNARTCKIISSDEIRSRLIGKMGSEYAAEGGRYSPEASAVSAQAFQILQAELEAYTKFPVNTEVVILDTTGFSEKFRENVLELAEKRGYQTALVSFEFKHQSDYLKSTRVGDEEVRRDSLSRFRKHVLPRLGGSRYNQRIRVTKFGSWPDVKFKEAVNPEWLENQGHYMVIGDSHEQIDLVENIVKVADEEGRTVIHLGDWIDKGTDPVSAINYMYDRKIKGDIFIRGNHENYVYGVLQGHDFPRNMEKEPLNFTSLTVLLNSELPNREEILNKFFEIFEASVPFAIIKGGAELPIYLSHAPCENRFLGKTHLEAIRAQRNYKYSGKTTSTKEELQWLFEEADINHPIHIFGHITHFCTGRILPSIKYKNKVFLDTGAVYGGGLCALRIDDGKITNAIHLKATSAKRGSETRLAQIESNLGLYRKELTEEDFELTAQERRQLKNLLTNGAKYLSGTMSPSASSSEEIEPLSTAYSEFIKAGVKTAVMQRKYMGSRCQAYIYKDPSKNWLTSRGGWKIKRVYGITEEEFQAFVEGLTQTHLPGGAESVVLDGELMPWATLGAPLISEQFVQYQEVVAHELSNLMDATSGIGEIGGESAEASLFGKGFFDGKIDHLSKYRDALNVYAAPGKVEFKGFSVLLVDDKPFAGNEEESFLIASLGNTDDIITIDLEDEESKKAGQAFFEKTTIELKMEGIVLKPLSLKEEADIPRVPPYMKVRSPEYLRLVYGFDYTDRLPQLIKQKKIGQKLRTSIKEHEKAKEMLTASPERIRSLLIGMIGEIRNEKVLDPRL